MAVSPTSAGIRAAIKDVKGSWTRTYKDGTSWAGAGHYRGIIGMMQIVDALTAAGFTIALLGEPDTSGQYIVDVITANTPNKEKQA